MCVLPRECGAFLRAALGEVLLKEKNVNKLVAEVGFFTLAAYAAYAVATKEPERTKTSTTTRGRQRWRT